MARDSRMWGWNHKEPSLFSILTPSKSLLHTSPTAPHFPAPSHILLPSLAVKFQGKEIPNADYIFLGPSQLLANKLVPFPRKLFLNFIKLAKRRSVNSMIC